jgi:nucleotide-binding universal stress UspA family protein
MERGPIVCATEGSVQAAALERLAAELAVVLGCELDLVHASAPELRPGASGASGGAPRSEAERVLLERVQARAQASRAALERARQAAEARGAKVASFILEGRPWEAVVEHAYRREATAIVVGPHGSEGGWIASRGALTEHLLGSTADRIVRHAGRPVLVGPRRAEAVERGDETDAEASRQSTLRGGRWLVALDGSDASLAALRLAQGWASRCGAELAPVYVARAVSPDETEGGPAAHEFGALAPASGGAASRERVAALERVVRETLGPSGTLRVVEGAPHLALSDTASSLGASLIVMGTHGRSGLAHLLLGSVTERTLRRSALPVLTVPASAD